ncbi:hypothetical protein BC828DRAFT_248265 [Blastocladiella britannica]|nr:hypothetical protein BC828DRAFT_248265 [Blastocladiella britannica]
MSNRPPPSSFASSPRRQSNVRDKSTITPHLATRPRNPDLAPALPGRVTPTPPMNQHNYNNNNFPGNLFGTPGSALDFSDFGFFSLDSTTTTASSTPATAPAAAQMLPTSPLALDWSLALFDSFPASPITLPGNGVQQQHPSPHWAAAPPAIPSFGQFHLPPPPPPPLACKPAVADLSFDFGLAGLFALPSDGAVAASQLIIRHHHNAPMSPVPSLEPASFSASPSFQRAPSADATTVLSTTHPTTPSVVDASSLAMYATANVMFPIDVGSAQSVTAMYAGVDMNALLGDVPELEHPTAAAVAPKRRRTGTTATKSLPSVMRQEAPTAKSSGVVIPTATRRAPQPSKLLPAVLSYPVSMIAHDAPIKSRKRKLAEGIDDMEMLPADATAATDHATKRRIINAVSARRSRARKLAKEEFLESRVTELESEQSGLLSQVAELERALAAAKAAAGIVPPVQSFSLLC